MRSILRFLSTERLARLRSKFGFLDTIYARIGAAVAGWLVVLFLPVVAFDVVGGQSAIEILRYIVFRGIDRDEWYATSPILMAGGFLSASALLLAMAIQTVGLLFRDKDFGTIGSGVTLLSLPLLAWTANPIAAATLFGVISLPHIGWWLMLVYAPVIFFTFHSVDGRTHTRFRRRRSGHSRSRRMG